MTCPFASGTDLDAYLAEPRAEAFASFRDHWPACRECSSAVLRASRVEDALRSIGLGHAGLHPAETILLVFVDDPTRLEPLLRDEVRRHVAACRTCADEIRALARFESVPRIGSRARFAWRPAWAAAAALLLAVGAALLWRLHATPALDGTAAPARPPLVQATPSPAPVPSQPRVAEAPAAAPAPAAPTPSPAVTPKRDTPPATPAAPRAVAQQVAPPAAKPAPIVVAAVDPSQLLHYAPPLGAGSGMRRVDGAARSPGEAPTLLTLAPDHVGRTASASPTLYFFLDRRVDAPIELSVVDPGAIEPLAELTLPPPRAAGIHAVSLAERGVTLRPNVRYRWSVALVRDPENRSGDVVASAAIERTGAPPKNANADALAQAGLFYDALAAVSGEIASHPGDARYRARRAALLEQVGLEPVAAFDRR